MGRVQTEEFNGKISMSVVAAGQIALPSPDGVALPGLETVVVVGLLYACYVLYILY